MPTDNAEALRALIEHYDRIGTGRTCGATVAASLRELAASQPQAAGAGGDAKVIYTAFDKNMEERLFHTRDTAERHAVGGVRTWQLVDAGPHYRDSRLAATPAPAVERVAVDKSDCGACPSPVGCDVGYCRLAAESPPAEAREPEPRGAVGAWLYEFPHDGETDHALSRTRFLPSWIEAKRATETPLFKGAASEQA